MGKSKNSNHIQIPTSVLEKFSLDNKGKLIYCCNYEREIALKPIKECNAQIGYYEQETEDKLRSIENNFGRAKKQIIDLIKGKKKIDLAEVKNKVRDKEQQTIIEDKYINWIYDFFCISLKRAKTFIEKVRNGADYSAISLDLQDYILQKDNDFDFLKKSKNICLFHNATDLGFVIPQMCWYCAKWDSVFMYFMPLTPYIGIGLYISETQDEFARIYQLDDEREVDVFNRLAILQEFVENKQAIYAKQESDLQRYDLFIKKDFENEIQI